MQKNSGAEKQMKQPLCRVQAQIDVSRAINCSEKPQVRIDGWCVSAARTQMQV